VARLQALSLGYALDARAAAAGVVHSVYPRAANLEVRGELWTLLAAAREDLPLGIRLEVEDLGAFALRRGDTVRVRAGYVGIGEDGRAVVLDCRAAPRWTPACRAQPAPGLAGRLALVAAAAHHRAWAGSARMAHDVVSALDHGDSLPGVIAGVIGCGPGATPAGDDVLVGVFAALALLPAGARGAAAARMLEGALRPLLPGTADLSAHLLRQAAGGLFGRPVHDLADALACAADAGRVQEALRRVLDMGATSGADLCTGIASAAHAFLLH
jgi:hypothetical protein